MYHLAWFQGCGLPPWNHNIDGPFVGNIAREWASGENFVDLARALERGGFTFLLMEDTTQVDDQFGGTAEVALKRGFFSPKHDPFPISLKMALATKHIGFAPTISSSFYHPWAAARLLTTLDHVTAGRIGMNVVTSTSDNAARNFGMEVLPPKNVRYEIANEWCEIFRRLEGAWEDGAVLADSESGYYADHRKVSTINFKGRHYSSRGPLNMIPGPQRNVPMVEAGNSPAGRDLAAHYADAIIGNCLAVADMRELVADMRARLAGYDRNPDAFKVMFLCEPVVAESDDEAKRRHERMMKARSEPPNIEWMRFYLDLVIPSIDFSSLDLEMTVAEFRKGADPRMVSIVDKIFQVPDETTFREVLSTRGPMLDLGLVGSSETVARKMDEMMEEVGGAGFLINAPADRRAVVEFCDGLCPALQRRGSIRTGYDHRTFRENLLAH
jgi:FMN-dependent oxidoreductase (nitrilotriacetate monooxygenase family)